MKSFYENKLKKEEVVYELVKIGFEAKIVELSGAFSNSEEENEKVIKYLSFHLYGDSLICTKWQGDHHNHRC